MQSWKSCKSVVGTAVHAAAVWGLRTTVLCGRERDRIDSFSLRMYFLNSGVFFYFAQLPFRDAFNLCSCYMVFVGTHMRLKSTRS